MATPHINAELGDFSDVVIMPGDPLRAKYIATKFLKKLKKLIMQEECCLYRKLSRAESSVMGHGMGIPSCSIYAKN